MDAVVTRFFPPIWTERERERERFIQCVIARHREITSVWIELAKQQTRIDLTSNERFERADSFLIVQGGMSRVKFVSNVGSVRSWVYLSRSWEMSRVVWTRTFPLEPCNCTAFACCVAFQWARSSGRWGGGGDARCVSTRYQPRFSPHALRILIPCRFSFSSENYLLRFSFLTRVVIQTCYCY